MNDVDVPRFKATSLAEEKQTKQAAAAEGLPTDLRHPRTTQPTKELNVTIVGILVVIVLILLAVYLFRRVV